MRRGIGIAGLTQAARTKVQVQLLELCVRKILAEIAALLPSSSTAPDRSFTACKHLADAQEQYKLAGDEVKKSSLGAMKEQMALFKRNLEAFAAKHKADIRKDPVFRAQFHTMCANIGVDPLASNKVSIDVEVLGSACEAVEAHKV